MGTTASNPTYRSLYALEFITMFGRASSLSFFYGCVYLLSGKQHIDAFDISVIAGCIASYVIHSRMAPWPTTQLFKHLLLSSTTFSMGLIGLICIAFYFDPDYARHAVQQSQNMWLLVAVPLLTDLSAFRGEPSYIKERRFSNPIHG